MSLSEEERGFLAHIADDPFDDNRRLIFADWLEERGDPRSELIRLQIEYERLHLTFAREFYPRSRSYDELRAAQLEERIDKLTTMYGKLWHGNVPRACRIEFKGGLLAVCVTSAQDLLAPGWLSHLFGGRSADHASLQHWWQQYQPWIVRLSVDRCDDRLLRRLIEEGWLNGVPLVEITGYDISNKNFKFLGKVESLRGLKMHWRGVNDAGFLPLDPLPRLHSLELTSWDVIIKGMEALAEFPALRILRSPSPQLAQGERNLERLDRLTCLSLDATGSLDPEYSTRLLHQLTNLRYLNITCSPIESSVLHDLTEMAKLEELIVVVRQPSVLRNTEEELTTPVFPMQDEQWLRTIGQLPSLKSLTVIATGTLGNELQDLVHSTTLQLFDADNLSLSDKAATAIAQMPALRSLVANGERLLSPAAVADLTRAPCLESLEIGGLCDDTLPLLGRMMQLRRLVLTGRHITDAGIENLPVLPALSNLELGHHMRNPHVIRLENQPNLRWLTLFGTRRESEAFQLHSLPPLLEKLWLMEIGCRDTDFNALSTLKELRELRLYNTHITNEGFRHIANLPRLSVLNCFEMETELTDEGINCLEHCQTLERLALYQSGISEAGILRLAQIPRLRSVTLSRSPRTEKGVPALEKARPDLIVQVC